MYNRAQSKKRSAPEYCTLLPVHPTIVYFRPTFLHGLFSSATCKKSEQIWQGPWASGETVVPTPAHEFQSSRIPERT